MNLHGIALAALLYTGTATGDELTSRGLHEVGPFASARTRIEIKVAMLPVYLALVEWTSHSQDRWKHKTIKWGVPAIFLAETAHNLAEHRKMRNR